MTEPNVISGAFSISCNGRAFSDDIDYVRVVQEIGVPTMFEFMLPVQTMDNPWGQMTLKRLKPGYDVKVGLGRGVPTPMVTGSITTLWPELDTRQRAKSKLTVVGFDRLDRLRFGTQTRTFARQTDHSIVMEIARDAGLSVRTEGRPGKPHEYLLQNNESDYDFLCRRCAERNYEMLMDGTTLVFRPAAEGVDSGTSLLYYKDFYRASLRLSVPRLGSSVTALGYDLRSGEVFKGNVLASNARLRMGGKQTGYEIAAGVLPPSQVALPRPDLTVLDAAQDFAQAQYARGINRFIEGTVSVCPGNALLTAGINVELTGFEGPFDGLYYIVKSVHVYEQGEYETELHVRRSGI